MKERIKVLTAMLIWGSLGLVVRQINLPSAQIVLWRAILGGGFLFLLLLMRREPVDKKMLQKSLPLLLCSGGVMGLNWVLLFEAYRYTTVSAATLAYYCAPVIVTLAAPIVLKEKLTWPKLLGVCGAMAGMVLIGGAGAGGQNPAKGILCGLSAAAFYAAVMLMNKFVKGLSGLVTTVVQLFGAGVVMLVYITVTGTADWSIPTGAGLVCLITVGFLHTGVALWMFFSALRVLPAQTSALLSYIDPASALVFSALFLHEPMGPAQIAGAVLILGGAAFGELYKSKNKIRQ